MVLVMSVGLDRVPSQGLDRTDRTNCSRMGLEPREQFEQSYSKSTPRLPLSWTLTFSLFHFSSSLAPRLDGTCKRYSDAQVSIWYSILNVINTRWWRTWFLEFIWLSWTFLLLGRIIIQTKATSRWLRTHQALHKKVSHLCIQSQAPPNLKKKSTEEEEAINPYHKLFLLVFSTREKLCK